MLKLIMFFDEDDDEGDDHDLLPITCLNNLEILKLRCVEVKNDKSLISLANKCKKLEVHYRCEVFNNGILPLISFNIEFQKYGKT